jgi:bleomycin hydrolase
MKFSKITFVLLIGFILPFTLNAKDKKKSEEEGYKFTTVAEVPVTSMKNQYKSGTCWSFATTSFVEAEILRITGKELDLSEMFSVYWAYVSKAANYVRLHGLANFSPGGQAHDVIDVIREHGIITEEAYNGLNYNEKKHIHGELDEVLKDFLKGIIKNKNGYLSPVWPLAFADLLNAYLGEPPAKFDYEGQKISPVEFRKKMKFNPDDYVEITSYSHHPFYEQIRLEIPDNWSYNDDYYNIPVNDMMEVINNALNNGYSVCWDGDVSGEGFSHRKGVAILPVTDKEDLKGTEMSRWQKMTSEDFADKAYGFKGPFPEKNVSQKDRQKTFDNWTTTDDHLMHLTGIVKDQNGTIYYRTKNSWGESNKMKGYLNMSESYVRLNTIAIMIHKDAIPENIKSKLGIK